MGFQWRGRTKGKDSWTNWSMSSRGLHASRSVKFGNLTVNIGRNGVRSTYNIGNGLKCVSRKKRKKKAPTSKSRWSWDWLHNIQVPESKVESRTPLTPEQEKRQNKISKIFFRFLSIPLLYIGLTLIATDHYYLAGLVFVLVYWMW